MSSATLCYLAAGDTLVTTCRQIILRFASCEYRFLYSRQPPASSIPGRRRRRPSRSTSTCVETRNRFRKKSGKARCPFVSAVMRYLVYAHILVGEQPFRQLDSLCRNEPGHCRSRYLFEYPLEFGRPHVAISSRSFCLIALPRLFSICDIDLHNRKTVLLGHASVQDLFHLEELAITRFAIPDTGDPLPAPEPLWGISHRASLRFPDPRKPDL